jgi:hypothetical protein
MALRWMINRTATLGAGQQIGLARTVSRFDQRLQHIQGVIRQSRAEHEALVLGKLSTLSRTQRVKSYHFTSTTGGSRPGPA